MKRRQYRVHQRGSFNTFTRWADAAHFMKYLLDSGNKGVSVEIVHD